MPGCINNREYGTYWVHMWLSCCILLMMAKNATFFLSPRGCLDDIQWYKAVPYHWQNVPPQVREPAPYMGQVLSKDVSAHYRCQCRNNWKRTETIYTSLEALAANNQPVKYQSPTTKSVSTRASFRKSDRTCPGLPYWFQVWCSFTGQITIKPNPIILGWYIGNHSFCVG